MSRTIGNMILKATPVGTDAVAIADSEDSDKTKKVLLSALSGGASNVHIVENMTVSSGNYSGTSSDVTQYEDKHLYVFNAPDSYVTSTSRTININSLGAIDFYFNHDSGFSDVNYPSMAIPGNPYTTIVTYDKTTNKFYLVSNTRSSILYSLWCSFLHATTLVVGNGSNNYAMVKQFVREVSGADVTIDFMSPYSIKHSVTKCTTSLTSLTLNNVNSMSEFEKEIQFTTASSFTFTATQLVGKWLGSADPTFDPNTSYVIRIKNGYGICYKVGA